MKGKQIFGLTIRELVLSIVSSTLASIILGILGILLKIIQWNELLVLRLLVVFVLQSLICLVIAKVAKSISEKETRLAHEAELSRIQGDIQKLFKERTDEHHWFAHFARDFAVKLTGDFKPTKAVKAQIPQELMPDLKKMLEQIYKTFRCLISKDVKLFVAIRERRGDKYHTLSIRAGDVNNAARDAHSKPLHENDPLIAALIDDFKHDKCVMQTGTWDTRWKYPDHDGVHKSVLLGAVFSKRWKKEKSEFSPVKLEWVLSIAANQENVFNDSHIPLMKCFNDICGLLVNVTLRHQLHEENYYSAVQALANLLQHPELGVSPAIPAKVLAVLNIPEAPYNEKTSAESATPEGIAKWNAWLTANKSRFSKKVAS